MSFSPSPRYKPRHVAPEHSAYAGEPSAADKIAGFRPQQGQVDAAESQDVASVTTTSATRSSIIMFLGTLVSRALGMVRSPMMLGAVVGLSSPAASSFDIANNVPNILYGILAGGLINAALVPAIVKATEKGREEGAEFINKLMTFSVVVIGAITLAITLSAPLIVKIFASQLSPEWHQVTVVFAYWCLPQIFFYGIYAVLGQILNANEKFGPYMWSPALNNVVAIIGLVVMLVMFGPESPTQPSDAHDWHGLRTIILAGSATLGIALQAIILLVPIYRLGIRLKPDFAWRNSGLGETGRVSTWVLATMVLGMFPLIALINVASAATVRALDQGVDPIGVANNFTYTAAYALYSLPTSLVTVSIITAMFPRMARAAVRRNIGQVRADASVTLRTVGTFNALATAVIIVTAIPLSRLMVPSAAPESIKAMAWVLIALTIGLVGSAMQATLTKVYYAFQDTRTAFLTAAPVQIASVPLFFLAGMLPVEWVVPAACFVNTLANYAIATIQWSVLSKRMGGLDTTRVLGSQLRAIGVGAATAGLGWLIMTLFGYDRVASSLSLAVVALLVVGALMCVAFVVICRVLKFDEAALLVHPLDKVLRRFRRA